MITIFWTLARLLEMHSAKNFVGNDPPHGVLAMTKCRDSDWGENDIENLLLGKAIVVLATTICER